MKQIYYNGSILTMDANYPFAEAVGVINGRITAVGTFADVQCALGEGATPVDLKGMALLPGFIDGHSHFPSGGMNRLFGVDCSVGTINELKARLAEKINKPRPSEWIVGHSFDEQFVEGKLSPTVSDLDAVTTKFPIFMRHVSGHTGYANSLALRMAGIDAGTPNPAGGIIGHFDNGEPNGVLEGIPAQTLVRKIIPPFTMDEMKQAMSAESLVYAATGITTAQGGPAFSPMDAELGYKVVEMMIGAATDGTLPLRVVLFARANNVEKLFPYPTTASGSDLSGNGMVTLGAAKLWSDGDPRAHTGYFLNPYKPQAGETEPYYGEFLYTADELADLILPMHRRGWQIAIHANGDGGVETVVQAFEKVQQIAPRTNPRHLVIHAQYATRNQMLRMKHIGAYPCFFIAPLYYWDTIHADQVGDERVNRFCPLNDAERIGLPYNLHTDSPILPVNPLTLVQIAVTRTPKSGIIRGRKQAVSVYQALQAVTIHAAYLNFEEHVKGSIAPGKYADFVILENSPLDVPMESIKDIKVHATIVGGKTVFKA